MRLINLILEIITINSVPFGILNPSTIISSVVSLEVIGTGGYNRRDSLKIQLQYFKSIAS